MNKLVIYLLLSCVFNSSCRRDSCEDTPPDYVLHLTIGDSMRSKVPHTGFDTLIFTNQYGDTVYLKGIGVNKFTTSYTYHGDINCGHKEYYNCDFLSLNYEKDTGLSNTIRTITIKNILISADSNSQYELARDGNEGGVSIPFTDSRISVIYFNQLSSKHYHTPITIGGKSYFGVPFYGSPLYFNEYQGILQYTQDTIIWTRILLL